MREVGQNTAWPRQIRANWQDDCAGHRFRAARPYTGQMKAVLHQMAPGVPVIDLFADAPVGNPRASAYLLAAYAAWFPANTVFLCVVDPSVGERGRPSL